MKKFMRCIVFLFLLVYTNPSGRVGATTLTVDQMPSHTHLTAQQYGYTGNADTYYPMVIKPTDDLRINSQSRPGGNINTWGAGGSQSHAHSLSATCTATQYLFVEGTR